MNAAARRKILDTQRSSLLAMLHQLAGRTIVKADLQALTSRSGSIEYKHQNISAVMAESLPFIQGSSQLGTLFAAVEAHCQWAP